MTLRNQNLLPALSPHQTLISNKTEHLSSLYMLQGEFFVIRGDLEGISFFDKALALDPSNPEIYYRQGVCLYEYGSAKGKEKNLLLANKLFKKAISLKPDFLEAWQAWGNSLFLLGSIHKERHYFLEAEKKLKQACLLSQDTAPQLIAEIYWDYAKVLLRLARYSKEAIDFHLAIDAFHKSIKAQEEPLYSQLWKECGEAYLEVSQLIHDMGFLFKAIGCFKRALGLDNTCFDSWILLAKSLYQLYFFTYDEDYFHQFQECFFKASYLKPQRVEIWTQWTQMLFELAKVTKDCKKYLLTIEKCQQGYMYQSCQPYVLGIWAQSLGMLGALTDNIESIHAAQNKLQQAIKENEDNEISSLLAEGYVLLACGEYFQDLDCYYQAIEKFQEILSLDRTHATVWYNIGDIYGKIGSLENDVEAFEKALHFYSKGLFYPSYRHHYYKYARILSQLGELKKDRLLLEQAATIFENILTAQQPKGGQQKLWLLHYATTLTALGNIEEETCFYQKALEILSQICIMDPEFSSLHYQLALVYNHLGDCHGEIDYFYKAFYHYHLAIKQDPENDEIILDWGVTLIHNAQHAPTKAIEEQSYLEAEKKFIEAAKLGNGQAFYQLACLYSLIGNYAQALYFLEKAHLHQSLPPIEEILEDEWLEGIRLTPSFQEFLFYLQHG